MIARLHTASPCTPLADLFPCPIERTFCLHHAVEEATDSHIPDAVAQSWRTVGDVLAWMEMETV